MKYLKENIYLSRFIFKYEDLEQESFVWKKGEVQKTPVVVFIHGHTDSREGAWTALKEAYALYEEGYTVYMPSQRGYGWSKGEPDFCGPKTVDAILTGLKLFLGDNSYKGLKVAIWGVSRGATVASQIITKDPQLFSAAILQAGVYDMKKNYDDPNKMAGIKENMEKETGGGDTAWKDRSSIYEMDKVTMPILILHGDADVNVSVEQAKLLDQKLKALNKEHKTVILEGMDHSITDITFKEYSLPFLNAEIK